MISRPIHWIALVSTLILAFALAKPTFAERGGEFRPHGGGMGEPMRSSEPMMRPTFQPNMSQRPENFQNFRSSGFEHPMEQQSYHQSEMRYRSPSNGSYNYRPNYQRSSQPSSFNRPTQRPDYHSRAFGNNFHPNSPNGFHHLQSFHPGNHPFAFDHFHQGFHNGFEGFHHPIIINNHFFNNHYYNHDFFFANYYPFFPPYFYNPYFYYYPYLYNPFFYYPTWPTYYYYSGYPYPYDFFNYEYNYVSSNNCCTENTYDSRAISYTSDLNEPAPKENWITAKNGDVPPNATAYQDKNGNNYYQCRAHYNHHLYYGEVVKDGCSVEDHDVILHFDNYQVLAQP